MVVALIPVGGSASLDDAAGRSRIERLAHNVVRFSIEGFLSDALAKFALDHSSLLVGDVGYDLCCFYDWQGMTGYTSNARSSSTNFMLQHRKRYRCAVILTGSPIVAMGVNVANVVLGGFLTATTKRDELDRLLNEALQR